MRYGRWNNRYIRGIYASASLKLLSVLQCEQKCRKYPRHLRLGLIEARKHLSSLPADLRYIRGIYASASLKRNRC